MLDFENIGEKFVRIVNTEDWRTLQDKFNRCNEIYVLGHGGNLAVADHAAVDITRLSNGTKNAVCPGSAIVATSLINDSSFDQWMVQWLSSRTIARTKSQMKKSLVLGISSSGSSTDVLKALQWANERGMEIAMLTSYDIPMEIPNLTKVILGAEYYHTSEVLTLLLTYELTLDLERSARQLEVMPQRSWKNSIGEEVKLESTLTLTKRLTLVLTLMV